MLKDQKPKATNKFDSFSNVLKSENKDSKHELNPQGKSIGENHFEGEPNHLHKDSTLSIIGRGRNSLGNTKILS